MRVVSKNLLGLFYFMLLSACTSAGLETPAPSQIATDSNIASTNLLQALNGGLVSRIESSSLSRADMSVALQNEYKALEYTAPGEAVLWQGRVLSGSIVPSQPYRVGSQDCRQYEHSVTERGISKTVRGTACRNEDGSWSLLS